MMKIFHRPDQVCPHCQTGNSSSARFCQGCGQPLADSSMAFPYTLPDPSVTGMLPANFLLADRYLIGRRVGQGGMGAVYEAADTRLGQRRCAIKEMSSANLPTVAERQLAVANFEQEAGMLARLNHPNLPHVTDYFSESGRHYMVMEFIEGHTLAEQLEAAGQPLPEAEVQTIAEQICIVLEYLHRQKPPIIFRDLKPENIMVQADGRVKLIDFGIARFFDTKKKHDTQLLGTPGYAAPSAAGSVETKRAYFCRFA